MILAPAVVLLLLEAGLRLSGYGLPSSFFVKVAGRDTLTTNRHFGKRFFPPAIARQADPYMVFPASKPIGTYRVFVLGSSAAYGDPSPVSGFSRILDVVLHHRYPDTDVEVINTAMVAIDSHVVREIARECLQHDADLLLIYMGNNEVVGPFGPGSDFKSNSLSLPVIRTSMWVRTTKIGELLDNLLRRVAKGPADAQNWKGQAMFLENLVPADSESLRRTYHHFRENLSAICQMAEKSHVKVILCTVAVNLKDNPPFASTHRRHLTDQEKTTWERIYEAGIALESAGDLDDAVDTYLKAARIDDRFAHLQFRLARCLLQLERFDDAHDRYVLACELDSLRFRADTRINAIVREIAAERESQGVSLLDADRIFQTSEKTHHGLPGRELFFDHVHMNFDGNYLLAAAALKTIEKVLLLAKPASQSPEESVPSKEMCARALGFSDAWLYQVEREMFQQMENPPWTLQIDHEKTQALMQKRLEDRAHLGSRQAGKDACLAIRKAIETRPTDLLLHRGLALMLAACGEVQRSAEEWRVLSEHAPQLAAVDHESFGDVLLALGQAEEAVSHYRRAVQLTPRSHRYWRLAKGLAVQRKTDEAIAVCWRGLELDPHNFELTFMMGMLLAQQEKIEDAEQYYHEAVRIDPERFEPHVGLARLAAQQGRMEQAIAHTRDALRLKPDAFGEHLQLANLLLSTGRLNEAVDQYRRASEINPSSATDRVQRAWVLFSLQRPAEAVAALEDALRLSPDSPDVALALARVLATHSDPTLRDGARAVDLAEKLIAKTPNAHFALMDVLAAAYAEQGRFEEAVRTATEAVKLAHAANRHETASQIERRLWLYMNSKPYHAVPEGAFAMPQTTVSPSSALPGR